MWDAYDEVQVTADEKRRAELFRDGVLEVWYQELPMAGFCSQFVRPFIVKNGLRNYPRTLPIDTTTSDSQLANNQTMFWDNPADHM